MESITDREWEKFFDIVDKIMEVKGETWQDKRDYIHDKAGENRSLVNFEEMCSWFPSE